MVFSTVVCGIMVDIIGQGEIVPIRAPVWKAVGQLADQELDRAREAQKGGMLAVVSSDDELSETQAKPFRGRHDYGGVRKS